MSVALKEAVGPFLALGERVANTVALRAPSTMVAHVCDDGCRISAVTTEDFQRLRAAYDAAKRGSTPKESGLTEERGDTLEMLADILDCDMDRTALVAAVTSAHEDAAKYRAAVERLGDRDGQAKAMHDVWGSNPEGAAARWVLYGDGPSPAPRETIDKVRVVEVLHTARTMHLEVAVDLDAGGRGGVLPGEHRAMADACTGVATRLDLTLDVGGGK